ncbi:hypothetical protein [Listeria phage P100plus]|uniref:Gp61 n=4 Tax=Pecentumvirus TaxID=1857844 RepID=A8AT85_BPA51|nr:gp61 [Listeria phage A511]YP_010843587.1 hypothetical protein PI27_gp020 [Listeria phage WIL-1]YP_406544.1 gp168 [Listeria phage P100]QJB22440.1 hypothetical protein [Listeria phage P100plus]QJB22630.1 hypothetical protein [Listeria phage P200]QKN84267.1 hypothetical protein [Listeria virus P61]AAY53032.1 gp61 [Listeria phage A511]AAY53471.1 gp168 [Listeria phage P100]
MTEINFKHTVVCNSQEEYDHAMKVLGLMELTPEEKKEEQARVAKVRENFRKAEEKNGKMTIREKY